MKINEKEVIKDFQIKDPNGVKIFTPKQLAERYKVRTSTIYYLLRKNDISVINRPELKEEFIKQLIFESKNTSQAILAKKYKIEKTRLCKIINSNNMSEAIKQTIINLRQQKMTHSLIAQRCCITTDAVKQVLRSNNFSRR